ncbi:uncharacterized protein LOC121390767 isoform X2 [Gigantopelta aegis]|uniref:uncharacterized protein LOC121390767 isoform X2 n=1 Tax=Gigantopelta aegis TaxID=1735272 RepID=UPI001B8886EA|nr:uncharacterized protein LOC121390767 isoform X2 [Gigantopelta aegis]
MFNRKVTTESFLVTYQFLPSYKYSEKHCLWVENPDSIATLPPPDPPPTSRAEIFNPIDYSEVDARADKTPQNLLKQTYSDLVKYLTKDCKSALARVRIIYRWITSIQVDQMLLPQSQPDPNTPYYQLWRIKNQKGNYAQLVSILCRLCNIICVIIHGKLKGSNYDVGQTIDDKVNYGEWNAVLIDGHWRLMDAYWGACSVGSDGGGDCPDETNRFVYACDENYFLTDPRQLIATHLPFNKEWQLMKDPITPARFEEMAFLKDRFFELGMSVLSHPECVIKSARGEEEIFFRIPEGEGLHHSYDCLLFRQETNGVSGLSPRYDRYVSVHRPNPDLLSIKIQLPVAGTFRLELVGKDSSIREPGYDDDWIAVYKIIFRQTDDETKAAQFADRIKLAAEAMDEEELLKIIVELKDLAKTEKVHGLQPNSEADDDEQKAMTSQQTSVMTSDQVATELKKAERELEIIQARKELVAAKNARDLKRLTAIVNLIKEKNYDSFMEDDVKTVERLIERLRHIHRLSHDIIQMDQSIIAELKGYAAPPEVVHRVLMAAFLLLGNFTDETKDWSKLQALMGKTMFFRTGVRYGR